MRVWSLWLYRLLTLFPRSHQATGGAVETTVFKRVMVCSGHHWKERLASFPGQSKFLGRQMHSHAYKDYHPFADQRVLVVGIGNSGTNCDRFFSP